jgi:predicted nucleic acid-binding protein
LSSPLVVDASVAVKWLISEADSGVAEALSAQVLTAPSLVLVECASALWRRARAGDVPMRALAAKMRALRLAPLRLEPLERHLDHAVELATELQHSVHDCVYLAMALASGAQVVSADRRFVSAVRRRPDLAGSIVLLGETAH